MNSASTNTKPPSSGRKFKLQPWQQEGRVRFKRTNVSPEPACPFTDGFKYSKSDCSSRCSCVSFLHEFGIRMRRFDFRGYRSSTKRGFAKSNSQLLSQFSKALEPLFVELYLLLTRDHL